MKSIAVLVGYGPDVDFLLDNRNLVPDEVELFRLNVRGLDEDADGLPLLNPLTWNATILLLKKRGLLQVATFGSLRFRVADAGPLLKDPGAYVGFWEALPYIVIPSSSSDQGRRHIFSKLELKFTFPRVVDVLPCLFVKEDVAVYPNDELRARALKDRHSYQKDAFFKIDKTPVKVFRVPKEPSRNVITRRLDPVKLREIHEKQKARHFFFDRERTTVIDIAKMIDYARANGLTLQSFLDCD